MAKVGGKFTIDISKTADLTPPALDCEWEVEFDGDPELEKVLIGYFKKNYEDGLQKVMAEQAKHFGVPLASMQKEIDELRKLVAEIHALTDPAKIMAKTAEMKKRFPTDLVTQVKDYNDYLKGAVENVKKQQMAIYGKKFEAEAFAAARKSIKKDIDAKKFRVVVGAILRGVLVLSVAAAAIAATVLTFGTAGVAFAAIAAASAGLGGASALLKVRDSYKNNLDQERRSMELLIKDVAAVTGPLTAMEAQVKGLASRVNDVSTYYSARRSETAALAAEFAKLDAKLATIGAEATKLKGALPAMSADQLLKVAEARKAVAKAKLAWEASNKRDEELKKVLESAKAAIGDLNKIPFHGAKGMMAGLTGLNLKDVGTYTAVMDNLSSITASVGAIGMAKTAK